MGERVFERVCYKYTGVTPKARRMKYSIAAARSDALYCLRSVSRRVKLAIAYSSSLWVVGEGVGGGRERVFEGLLRGCLRVRSSMCVRRRCVGGCISR